MLFRLQVQNAFGTIAEKLRQLLGTLTDQSSGRQDPGAVEHDGFGPIKTTQSTTPQEEHASPVTLATRSLAEICIIFLASVPALQCPTGQTPRDKELIKLVVECPEEKLLLLGPPLLTAIRRRLLTLSLDVLDNLLVKCADLLRRYSHAINDQFHLLVVDLLKSSLRIWIAKEAATSPIGEHVQVLCGWISSMMEAAETKKKTTFWGIRDLVARFLAEYLAEDPSQTFWPADYHDVEIKRPLSTLLALNLDEDVRVRFRAAVLSASLFAVNHDELIHEYDNLDDFYQLLRDSLPRDLAQYAFLSLLIIRLTRSVQVRVHAHQDTLSGEHHDCELVRETRTLLAPPGSSLPQPVILPSYPGGAAWRFGAPRTIRAQGTL